MRSSDIVTQLAIKLPALVDDFTLNNDVVSLTRSGTTVTVTTATEHNLAIGKAVNIVGARTPINIISIDRVGIVATLETDSDHDMTKSVGFENVEIEGATEPEFNGVFKLLNVKNRRIITFQVADSGPTTSTGTPLLINGENIFNTYNGLQEITAIPTDKIFEFETTNTGLFTPASGIIVAKTTPLISAAVTYQRILEAYTKQVSEDVWIFVVLGDGIAHKDRQILVDSTSNIQRTHYFNQRITQTFSLYLFIPSTTEIAARQARDRAEELLLPISQSILFAKFNSLLSAQFVNPLQFNEHGFHDYNGAFYVHRYTFEETLQMTIDDTVGPDEDVAFRDIDMTIGLDVGSETFESSINLDEEPLP